MLPCGDDKMIFTTYLWQCWGRMGKVYHLSLTEKMLDQRTEKGLTEITKIWDTWKFHQGKMRIQTSRVSFASWPQFPPAPVLLGVQISRHFRCFGAHFDLHVQGQTLLRCSKKTWRKKKGIVIWLVVQPLRKLMVSWDDYSQYMEK